MERLTHSPNIVHAFGFCGQSVITEAADDESAREYLKNTSLTSLDRLKIARDLARAMYHVHSIDYPNATNVTFVHNDVNMANLVQVQGRIKLNDFNIGVLQRWNTTSQSSICRSPVLFAQPLWKSPEEQPPPPHPNTPTAPSTLQFVENAAATDVYGLGNLLFQILTTRQPWTHLEPNGPLAKDQVVQLKRDGGRPYVPPEFSNSTDGAVQILYQVTMACFATNPNQRPTSFEAFRMLDGAAQSLETAAARESSKQ
jgi:serine/threonine protein kinase